MKKIILLIVIVFFSCAKKKTKDVFKESPEEIELKAIGYYNWEGFLDGNNHIRGLKSKFQKRDGKIYIRNDSVIFNIDKKEDDYQELSRVIFIDSVTTDTLLTKYNIENYFFWCRTEEGERKQVFIQYDTLAYEYKYHSRLNANYIVSIDENPNDKTDISFFTSIYCEKLK